MSDDRAALAAALAGPIPDAAIEFAKVELRGSHHTLHLRRRCGAEPLTTGTVRDLVTAVPATDRLSVCRSCLLEHKYAPRNPRALWARDLDRIITVVRSTAAVAYLAAQTFPRESAAQQMAAGLTQAAAVFVYDNVNDYSRDQDAGPWTHPHLAADHDNAWAEGKRRFEQAAARRLATSALQDRPPVEARWAVVPKTDTYWAGRYFAHEHDRACAAALLEGPKLAQTRDWFITPATWDEATTRTRFPETLPARDHLPDRALEHALAIWNGGTIPALDTLIEAVASAATPVMPGRMGARH